MSGIARKWRPSLWQVVGGALLGTLGMSFVGLVVLRLLGPVIGYRWGVALVGAVILLATLVLLWLLMRLLLRPITALADRAAALRRDPMARAEPLAHYGTQELRDLGESVLAMASRLQAREATIRSFTDHVTHEMKTPLSSLRAAAELLEDQGLEDTSRQLVATMAGAVAQMERQLQALQQAAAAREPGHHGMCRLADLLPDLVAAHPGLRVVATGETMALPLDAGGLGIVLQQLLSNAVEAGAGEVHLEVSQGILRVTDDGRGISDGNRAHVFKPFFTTRRETGGTGMGLTIVANLLAAHGAEIRVLRPNQGAGFEIGFGAG
jgi:two-component system OmpR family sensor kinase